MREDEKGLVPYTSLSHMARVKKLDSEAYVSELHNVVKLIYAETEMRTAAKAKRLEVLSGVIDRCTTMEERTKFQLQQAEVAQQPVLDGRLVSALLDTLDRMREETERMDGRAVHADLTFIDDMSPAPAGKEKEGT